MSLHGLAYPVLGVRGELGTWALCHDSSVSRWALSKSVHCLILPPFSFKQQNLEQRQADVEYELRCLLNKPGEPRAQEP